MKEEMNLLGLQLYFSFITFFSLFFCIMFIIGGSFLVAYIMMILCMASILLRWYAELKFIKMVFKYGNKKNNK